MALYISQTFPLRFLCRTFFVTVPGGDRRVLELWNRSVLCEVLVMLHQLFLYLSFPAGGGSVSQAALVKSSRGI